MAEQLPKAQQESLRLADYENLFDSVYQAALAWLRDDLAGTMLAEFTNVQVPDWLTLEESPGRTYRLPCTIKRAVCYINHENTAVAAIAVGTRKLGPYERSQDPSLQFGFVTAQTLAAEQRIRSRVKGHDEGFSPHLLRNIVQQYPLHREGSGEFSPSIGDRLCVEYAKGYPKIGNVLSGHYPQFWPSERFMAPDGATALLDIIKQAATPGFA